MKTKLLVFVMFLIGLTSFSQNTYVPDDNFEQFLINSGYDVGPLDDYVPTANINTVTFLEMQFLGIADLTGIEDFTALEILRCNFNEITTLDLSQNTALTYLDLIDNRLTSLNISQNTALTNLDCSSNELATLDLSQNVLLNYLYCSDNLLTSLDVTQNTALTGLTCSFNQLTSLDVSQNLALKFLDCYNNQLTSLDTSPNIGLTNLNCYNNQLTSLDVSQNTALIFFSCYNNQLTSLNVGQNNVLSQISCSDNKLTSLDLSQNTALAVLICESNDLNRLNVKNGNNTIFNTFRTTGNPNLFCIEVDDAAYSTANWTNIDSQTSFNEDCGYVTYVPDDNFEQFLIDSGLDSGPLDDYVFTADIETLDALNINSKSIADLTGIEDFTSLVKLWCNFNQLTTLDLSNNTELNELECRSNQLTSLKLSTSNKLIWLTCYSNNLTTLDLSQNTILQTLSASNNQLSSLDLSNNVSLQDINVGNNQLSSLDVSQITGLRTLYCNDNPLLSSLNVKNGNNTIINYFYVINNPNLTCINVDNAAYSTTNWTNIDAQHYFSEDCSALAIDDFELDGFKLFPNPVNNEVNISINEEATYVIFNINGHFLMEGKLKTGDNHLNISKLSDGLYLLKIRTEKGFIGKKFIKM